MMQLHYYPSNASMAPHMLLREIGAPFELVRVDRDRDAHKSEAYLKLNPNGLIPVLVDGDQVLYESAAICLHLADRWPGHRLMPELGSMERAHAYKWLMWLTNTMQPALMLYYYPERWFDPGQDGAVRQLQRHAQARIVEQLGQIDRQLARHGGDWFLGDAFSVLDPFCFMLCRWTRGFDDHPARSFAHIGPYLERVAARPAARAAIEAEGLPLPWY